jgi:hypothetical protein
MVRLFLISFIFQGMMKMNPEYGNFDDPPLNFGIMAPIHKPTPTPQSHTSY